MQRLHSWKFLTEQSSESAGCLLNALRILTSLVGQRRTRSPCCDTAITARDAHRAGRVFGLQLSQSLAAARSECPNEPVQPTAVLHQPIALSTPARVPSSRERPFLVALSLR